MRKMAVLFVLLAFLAGCVKGAALAPRLPVNSRIVNIYSASVSVGDGTGDIWGSGVVIRHRAGEKLIVLTAGHVAQYMQKKVILIRVFRNYQTGWTPMVVKKVNEKTDLALLESMEPEKRNGPEVRIAERAKIGDRVIVIGAPDGDEWTVTDGLISNMQKDGKGVLCYRVSAPTYFGNSGGGAFNERGELVGLAHVALTNGFFIIPGGSLFVSLESIKAFL